MAYADDLALILKSSTKEELVHKANLAFSKISKWMRDSKLKITLTKAEALLIPRGHIDTGELRFEVGRNSITASKELRYLGIWIYRNLGIGQHAIKRSRKRRGQCRP